MTTWDAAFNENAPAPPDGMVDFLRSFLQDLARKNRLPNGVEILDRQELIRCLQLSLDDWNSEPPETCYGFTNHPGWRLLIEGAAIEAHRMEGQWQTRNQLTYTDGGINVAESDKTALHQSWMASFQSDYEKKKRMLKSHRNLEQAYGGASSEYKHIGSRELD